MANVGTGFIISGRRVYPQAFRDAGINIRNYLDDPSLRLKVAGDNRDGMKRAPGTRIRGVVFHTTKGAFPQPLKTGKSPDGSSGEANARYWSRSDGQAGAHLILDRGLEVLQTADLSDEITFHATSVNGCTIGIEIVQGEDKSLWSDQLDPLSLLTADFLTAWYEIQRQLPYPYVNGQPLPRLKAGGADCFGVYGHRDQTGDRGRGDPGDEVYRVLIAAGYEVTDFKTADLATWKTRQAAMNHLRPGLNLVVDGIPGTATCNAIRQIHGSKVGLWTPRLIDAEVAELRAA